MIVLLAAVALGGCRSAEGGADGEAGVPDRINFIIPTSPGGGTDTWARFVGPYLEKKLEGSPRITFENLAGGEGIAGGNEYLRRDDGTGSTMLVGTASMYFHNLLGRTEPEFDFAELEPLLVNGTGAIIWATKESGVTSIADVKSRTTPPNYGGITPTGLETTLLLLFELFEIEVDPVFGFESGGDITLAAQRGEIDIAYATSSLYQTQVEPLVEEGEAFPLLSMGVIDESGEIVRDPNFPDIPTAPDIYRDLHGRDPSGPAWDAFKSYHAAAFAFQKGVWATPETPEEVKQAFYDAARQLQEDQAFQDEARNVLGGYPMYAGDQVQSTLRETFAVDPTAREYVLALLADKYDTTVG